MKLYSENVFEGEKKSTKILVIVGPSGVGKTFLVKRLIEKYPFKLVLSTTTRPVRSGEVQNVDMHFVSDEEYQQLQQEGGFFSDFENFGAKYGYLRKSVTSIQDEGLIPVAIVYTKVVPFYHNEFPGDIFSIFLYPASLGLLEKRMRDRGDNESSIQSRLASCKNEIRDYEEFLKDTIDVRVDIKNDEDINAAVEAIKKEYSLD